MYIKEIKIIGHNFSFFLLRPMKFTQFTEIRIRNFQFADVISLWVFSAKISKFHKSRIRSVFIVDNFSFYDAGENKKF